MNEKSPAELARFPPFIGSSAALVKDELIGQKPCALWAENRDLALVLAKSFHQSSGRPVYFPNVQSNAGAKAHGKEPKQPLQLSLDMRIIRTLKMWEVNASAWYKELLGQYDPFLQQYREVIGEEFGEESDEEGEDE